jgi:protein involved in polysaccharide export with SLBB domain
MPFSRSSLLIAFLVFSTIAHAQDPPKPPEKVEEPAKPQPQGHPAPLEVPRPPVLEFKEEIKPLPLVAIPDDPPPHEGAFFDLPITIEPPDIIIVEVLESMAGRPITGERLVRPDGTISLGFYGDIHVRGLTLPQAKSKIVIHLRKYLNDETLGLLREVVVDAGPVPPGRNPFDLDPNRDRQPEPLPVEAAPDLKKPEPGAKPIEKKEERPAARISRNGRLNGRILRRARPISRQDTPKIEQSKPAQDDEPPAPNPKPKQEMVEAGPPQVETQIVRTDPANTDRVFVDIVSHNTKVYYVQGDVGVPGRLPIVGTETVLDALNYAGGFIPTAEPTDIHLYRPARGGKPAKDYKIDLDAIHKGNAKANLQVFPNDRIIVGRNPIVKKTVELDRAATPINSVMNSIFQYSLTARLLAAINTPPTSGTNSGQIKVNNQAVIPLNLPDPTLLTPTQRDALLKEWTEFLWSISSKEGGAMLDETAFREALMKKLTPVPEPK